MKRSELQRTVTGRCQFHRWVADGTGTQSQVCADCDRTRSVPLKSFSASPAPKPLKRGRGFAASPVQREKVAGRACVGCGAMQANEWTVIDPAHLCAKGRGGCDHPDCVVPLCRTATGGCHPAFDEGELDLIAKLEPAYRAEVAHAVMHLGLEGTRRRLAPSLYGRRAAGTKEAA